MCLITFAYCSHPRYRLVMAANRDEFYDRRTEPLHEWRENSDVVAGRDLQAGGTWMGISKSGRFAAVTNFREGEIPQDPEALSRGKLVADFLGNNLEPQAFAEALHSMGQHYNGFNLLLADRDKLVYCSNRSSKVRLLQPGVFSLSNHLLNTPWPKAVKTRAALRSALADDNLDAEALLSLLSSRKTYPDHMLPETGVAPHMERALSASFIVTPAYGTRSTTALLWHHDGTVELIEQTFLPGGKPGSRQSFVLPA